MIHARARPTWYPTGMRPLVLILFCASAPACGPETPATSSVDVTPTSTMASGAAPPPALPPTSSAAPRAPTQSDADGTWTGTACGERKYERVIVISGATFSAQDLVSPCPPSARCVWSGIVERKGKVERNGSTLTLVPHALEGKTPGAPFATALTIEGPGLKDELGCNYVRR